MSSPQISDWTPDRLPRLDGKIYVITGGNSGIGYEAARMLGQNGGRIVIAARTPAKAEAARTALQRDGVAEVEVVPLDLSSLASVREGAETLRRRVERIDGLINNAGIMQTPQRTTVDGYELQFATNHLGHFLWTSRLIDLVEAASGRVVTLSSIAHKLGRIDLDDLMTEKAYSPGKAYGQSKLANMMFALELDRRLTEAGAKTASIVCHPGYSNTNLQSTGPEGVWNGLYKLLNPLLAQPAEKGAIPTVLAAAGEEAESGRYYGPTGFLDARGPVGEASIASHARDREVWRQLWAKSEDLVGEPFRMP